MTHQAPPPESTGCMGSPSLLAVIFFFFQAELSDAEVIVSHRHALTQLFVAAYHVLRVKNHFSLCDYMSHLHASIVCPTGHLHVMFSLF